MRSRWATRPGTAPELCVKALSDAALYDRCRPVVVGDAGVIDRARGYVSHPEIRVNAVSEVSDASFVPGVIDVLDLALVPDVAALPLGCVSAEAGWAAFESVRTTIELALAGEVDATVTNALNKEALNLALSPRGMHFEGHTEIYAHYTHTASYAMMLCHHDFRVAHVSTHCSLREACERVRMPRVLEVIRLAWRACRDLGIERPRVAVAGPQPARRGRAASSEPRRSRRSSPRSRPRAPRGSTPAGPSRLTASSPR